MDHLRKYTTAESWALRSKSSTPTLGTGDHSNEDMDPVPVEKRTWTTFNYVAYWTSDAWNVATWQVASSMLAVGLSWRQALPAIALGNFITAVVTVFNGTMGARLHVAFPVLARSSFGFWFSYFVVTCRIILSVFWLAIQSWTGAQCMYQMLKAIWPSVATMPNHLPSNANITSSQMMSFFLYWLVLLPFMAVSPQRIRWLFLLKSILVPPAWIAVMIWSFVKVPSREGLFAQHTALSGSALSYAWLSALNTAIAGYATLAVNIPDFTRYAKNEQAQYVQLFIIPVAMSLAGFVGIAVTSAGIVLYGEALWNPVLIIDRWESRPATFFVAFTFALATLGTNISANTLSAANDMTALGPKYINIKRGQMLAAIIGPWALVPWDVVSSAQGFLGFMNGCSVFLGPFAAVMVADYWLVHRCAVDVPAMYRSRGRYRYTYGTNWRAVVALFLSITPNLPGLFASVSPSFEIGGVAKVYDLAWIFGFCTALVVYSVLSFIFPAQETFVGEDGDHEVKEDEASQTCSRDTDLP